MFTYVTLGVHDFEGALHFYDQILAALGWSRCDPDAPPGWAGWGVYEDDGRRETALWICRPFDGRPATAGNGTMVALAAATPGQVEGFHRRALVARAFRADPVRQPHARRSPVPCTGAQVFGRGASCCAVPSAAIAHGPRSRPACLP